MALHLVSMDDAERKQDQKTVVEQLTPLNVFILTAAVLFHDLGMHIHFNGFKQLINGFYDDVRVEFFNDLTWKKEWDNFMIEAKRFSGRERINLFGDEQATIRDIDFSKNTVDSDVQKQLIGEFIRRHHGRLAHEIALKGFPIKEDEIINFAVDARKEYKDIFGLIARSHSMKVRDAIVYVEKIFPADPHFPYLIEIPFLMCVLRIADYFQIDNTRTNAFLIKLKSITSPFSLNEHRAHLATEYFKTDERDPETLYVDAKPKDGLMYTKLVRLFEDIQRELDTSFAIMGEMYGRNRNYLRLRYRRIKSNLSHKEVISKYPYVPDVHKFEADTDLFKLLVGPLYGYDPSYGVREMIQNSVDACIELQYKMGDRYKPVINISIEHKYGDEYVFTISDNGKGMSLAEIKNYYLKAGASFRNSTEWKMDYQKDDKTFSIRRTGKFGIGVLASFLVGDSIEVTTKRYNESLGYTFNADLNHEFIEVRKNYNCNTGTIIVIKMKKETYELFDNDPSRLTKWYVLSYPTLNYYANNKLINIDRSKYVKLKGDDQVFENGISLDHKDYDSIIWTYGLESNIAINGIIIPDPNYKKQHDLGRGNASLIKYPFVSVIDRNNQIDLELSRNSVRGHLPFINELIEQCEMDFLFQLLFFKAPIVNDELNLKDFKLIYLDWEYRLLLNSAQYGDKKIYVTTTGYFLDEPYYAPIINELDHYRIFSYDSKSAIKLLPGSVCSLFSIPRKKAELLVLRGEGNDYLAASSPEIYFDNFESTKISKSIKSRLCVVERNQNSIVFATGDYKIHKTPQLLGMLALNKVDAVQITEKSLMSKNSLKRILVKHFGKPALIPHDMQKRKAYIKTLNPELIKYITEKRGINLD